MAEAPHLLKHSGISMEPIRPSKYLGLPSLDRCKRRLFECPRCVAHNGHFLPPEKRGISPPERLTPWPKRSATKDVVNRNPAGPPIRSDYCDPRNGFIDNFRRCTCLEHRFLVRPQSDESKLSIDTHPRPLKGLESRCVVGGASQRFYAENLVEDGVLLTKRQIIRNFEEGNTTPTSRKR